MTEKEVEQFRKEFKSIVYQHSVLEDNAQYLRKLHAYDKNGSHEKAITKALTIRDEIKEKIRLMLKGTDYEKWKNISKRLSVLRFRKNNALNTIERVETEIKKIQSPL